MRRRNIYWAIPEINETGERGVEDMEYPEVLEKEHVKLQGLIKKEVESPGVFLKKSCGISVSFGF